MSNRVINTVLRLHDDLSGGLVRAANNARRAGADISGSMVTATARVMNFRDRATGAMKSFASTASKPLPVQLSL